MFATRTALRDQIRRQRHQIDPSIRRAANEQIQQRTLAFLDSKWVNLFIYVSTPHEAGTRILIDTLLRLGRRIFVPAYKTVNDSYFPSELKDPVHDLVPGRHGILEPSPHALRPATCGQMNAFIMPGVVFDRAGNRLGSGCGYYDQLAAHIPAPKIGLAYHLQLVDHVPVRPEDIPVDFLITENEVIICQKP